MLRYFCLDQSGAPTVAIAIPRATLLAWLRAFTLTPVCLIMLIYTKLALDNDLLLEEKFQVFFQSNIVAFTWIATCFFLLFFFIVLQHMSQHSRAQTS